MSEDHLRRPTFAEQASWWLDGNLLADPKQLLEGLLNEHRVIADQAKTAADALAEIEAKPFRAEEVTARYRRETT